MPPHGGFSLRELKRQLQLAPPGELAQASVYSSMTESARNEMRSALNQLRRQQHEQELRLKQHQFNRTGMQVHFTDRQGFIHCGTVVPNRGVVNVKVQVESRTWTVAATLIRACTCARRA